MEASGLNPIEKLSPSVFEVRKFVTTVWNNPLLDQETIQFRDRAREGLVEFLRRSKIDPENVIAIPYGSILWT